MGSAYFIATEREVPGYSADAVEGKMLARADMQLDEAGFYESAGLPPLHRFCGDDPGDFLDEDDLADLDDPAAAGETWFDPDEGLAVVRALAAHLRATPGAVREQQLVLDDLALFETALLACQAEGVRWCLSIDI